MVTCRNGKAVLVTRHVVIRPRRVVADHYHHHHHQVHHTVKRELVHYRQGPDGKRFINRRAELLQYSQRLRESARLPVITPLTPLSNPSNNHQKTKGLDAQRKPVAGTPTCLGNCKMTYPHFFKLLKLRLGQERIEKNKKHSGHTGGAETAQFLLQTVVDIKKK